MATVLALVVACRGGEFVDLQVYRFGVEALWHGRDLYAASAPTSVGIDLPFIYPPFAAVLLTPFGTVPWWPAAIGMILLSVVALTVTLVLVSSRVGWRGVGLVAFPAALVLEPVRSTIEFGQVNLVVMALVVADCLIRRPRWPRGVLVGLAAAVKLTPLAFVLFFLVTKDVRAARNAAVTAAGATLLGFVVAPESSVRYWTQVVWGASGMGGSPYASNQSIAGALARLGAPGPVLWGVLAMATVCAAIWIMRRIDGPPALVVNAAAALLISPISWSHHWVWVVPALVVLAERAVRTGRRGWTAAAALVALTFVVAPHTLLPADQLRELTWAPWQHVVGNAYLLVTVGLLAVAVLRPQPRPVDQAARGAE